jgi:hypothetical protein
LDRHIPATTTPIATMAGSITITDADDIAAAAKDNTATVTTTNEQPPSSDFESDGSDIDDAIGNKTKTNSTNTKGSIQIDKENTG